MTERYYYTLQLKQNFQKIKLVTGKNLFFVISSFVLPILFVLKLAFNGAVLYENVGFSISVPSIRKQYSSFLKKFFVFRKFVSKLKYWKRLKFLVICHIKVCRSLKNIGLFWKSLLPFLEEPVLFPLPWKWTLLEKKAFSCAKTETNSNCTVKLDERSNSSFCACLKDHLFKHLLFNMRQCNV